MWTRAELKSSAKQVLRHSYWESVVVYLIFGAISIGATLVSAFIPVGGLLTTIFLMLPLTVGINYFFMQNQVAPPEINKMFFPFRSGQYMKISGSMAWMYLFTVLWSMLSLIGVFIILVKSLSAIIPFLINGSYSPEWPAVNGTWMYEYNWLPDYIRSIDYTWIPALVVSGVIYIAGLIIAYIKALSYSMTPYILTDNPFLDYGRALKLSMAMTDGHKWRIFVLSLSFIGWGLLAVLTLGIGSLFLAPYVSATKAQLYVRLRDNAINCGLTSPEELNVLPKK